MFIPSVLIRPVVECFSTSHYSFGTFVVAQLI